MNGFNASLYLPLRCGQMRHRIVVTAHVIGVLLLFLAVDSSDCALAAGLAVALNGFAMYYVAFKRPVQSPGAVWLSAERQWQLAMRGQAPRPVQLSAVFIASPQLIAVSFIDSERRRIPLLIFADEAPAMVLRRMRVYLLHGEWRQLAPHPSL